jgi:S-DNA-T family DNA segregation ATPase FtsK/SpoIIIE
MSITRRNTPKSVRKPLPPRLTGLLREIGWLLSVALAAFLAVILFTYSQSDPGWSHSGQGNVHNVGGALGAYLADILLSLFGLSTWWLVVLALYATWWGYRKLEVPEASDRRSLYIRSAGFALLLLSSAGLESQRLYSLHIALPEHPGGILGAITGEAVVRILGFTGGTLALLVLIAASLSLFTGISWLTVVEKTGEYLERSWLWAIETWTVRRERRVGQAATLRRDEMVMEEKRRNVDRAPVIIETPPPTIIKSERVQVEKQAPLFAEMPDSPLPPLHLLDAATVHVESLSAETLEFTSRLIERKLAEFNVQARVVAALPGPVITRYEIEPASGVKGSQIVNLAKDLARALSVVSIRVVETIPRQDHHGAGNPQSQTRNRAPVRNPFRQGVSRYGKPAGHGDGQGHRRQPGGGRSGQNAARTGGRHHRLGQVGGDQRDDSEPAVQGRPQPGTAYPG